MTFFQPLSFKPSCPIFISMVKVGIFSLSFFLLVEEGYIKGDFVSHSQSGCTLPRGLGRVRGRMSPKCANLR